MSDRDEWKETVKGIDDDDDDDRTQINRLTESIVLWKKCSFSSKYMLPALSLYKAMTKKK